MKLSHLQSVQEYAELLEQLQHALKHATQKLHEKTSITIPYKGGATTIAYLSNETLARMQASQ